MSRSVMNTIAYLKEFLYEYNEEWFEKKKQDFESDEDYAVKDKICYIRRQFIIEETAGHEYPPSYEIKKIDFNNYCWNNHFIVDKEIKVLDNFNELVPIFNRYFNFKIKKFGDTYLLNDLENELKEIFETYQKELIGLSSPFNINQKILISWLYDKIISPHKEKLLYLKESKQANTSSGLTLERCKKLSEFKLIKNRSLKDFYSPSNEEPDIAVFIHNLLSAQPKTLKGQLALYTRPGLFYIILRTLKECYIPFSLTLIESTQKISIGDRYFNKAAYKTWVSKNKNIPSVPEIIQLFAE